MPLGFQVAKSMRRDHCGSEHRRQSNWIHIQNWSTHFSLSPAALLMWEKRTILRDERDEIVVVVNGHLQLHNSEKASILFINTRGGARSHSLWCLCFAFSVVLNSFSYITPCRRKAVASATMPLCLTKLTLSPFKFTDWSSINCRISYIIQRFLFRNDFHFTWTIRHSCLAALNSIGCKFYKSGFALHFNKSGSFFQP